MITSGSCLIKSSNSIQGECFPFDNKQVKPAGQFHQLWHPIPRSHQGIYPFNARNRSFFQFLRHFAQVVYPFTQL